MDSIGQALGATPFPQLLSHLRKSEARQVNALKPERYILVLSHSLSRVNKIEVAAILKFHERRPIDIYGKEDLNNLLANHPQVERRHFKLWISSSTVLTRLLNNAINGRSDAMMMDLVDKLKNPRPFPPRVNNFIAASRYCCQVQTFQLQSITDSETAPPCPQTSDNSPGLIETSSGESRGDVLQ